MNIAYRKREADKVLATRLALRTHRISYITLKGGPIINIGMRETTHFTESQKNFLRPYFEDKEHYEFFAYLYAIWEEENER